MCVNGRVRLRLLPSGSDRQESQCPFVVPAKAGTQCLSALKSLGLGVRRGDEHEMIGVAETRRWSSTSKYRAVMPKHCWCLPKGEICLQPPGIAQKFLPLICHR